MYNLTQQLSAEESAYHRFSCGNKASLSSPTVRENLLNFHKQWYSSNIMTLAVAGKFDIPTLEQWVTSKFSTIVNKDIEVPNLNEPECFP